MVINTATREVDITPDVSLFRKVGSQPYRIPDAVAELADNEIDERLPGQTLTVEISLRMGKQPAIVVQGNGHGMTPETAAKALKMAYSEKSEEQIGEFGLGMKAACSNLGATFELVTCTSDAAKATRILYDEDEFLKRGMWKIFLEEIEKPFEHGTRITITGLKVNLYAGLKGTMLSALGRIFKHFLEDGSVVILVNDEPVVPEEPSLWAEYTKQFSFEVQGHKIYGWYGLLARSSQTGGYGFELIRHRRAMLRHEKIGFKPHPRLARLTGEIHLDTFPVTNNKMDFVRDTPLWREFEEMIAKVTADIRGIAGKLASKKLEQKDLAEIEAAREEVEQALNSRAFQATVERRALDQMLTQMEQDESTEEVPIDVEKRDTDNGSHDGKEDTNDDADKDRGDHQKNGRERTPRVTQERIRRVRSILPEIEIDHEPVALGEDAPYKTWEVAATNPNYRLLVGSNLDHPMYAEANEDLALWVKHNMVEAAAEFLCRDYGLREMLLLKSDLLKHIGRMKLEEITESPVLA